jgi:hypothetical protein
MDGAIIQNLDNSDERQKKLPGKKKSTSKVKSEQFVYEIEDMESFLTDLFKFESKLADLYVNHHIKTMQIMRTQIDKRAVKVDKLEDTLKIMTGLIKGTAEENSRLPGRSGDIAKFLIGVKNSRKDAPFTETKRLGMELKDNKKGIELIHGVNERTRALS